MCNGDCTCSKLIISPCSSSHLCIALTSNQEALKGHNLRNHKLNRRRRRSSRQTEEKAVGVVLKTEMEIKNLKLYMENKSITEENEKLRKKAFLLRQENQALLNQLQKKFSDPLHDHLADHNSNNN